MIIYFLFFSSNCSACIFMGAFSTIKLASFYIGSVDGGINCMVEFFC